MKQMKIQQLTCARIPTDAGQFQLCYYQNDHDDKEHLALVLGEIAGQSDVLVRIHSECFTGDVLGSLRCDCGPQLQQAMQLIAAAGRGVIVYLRQEGRGIGLLDKLRAYNLQDEGYDTVDANLMLGHQADARDYTVAALILRDLGVHSLKLITNNPAKIESLQQLGVAVTERVPLQTAVTPENKAYLMTKVARMRHLLTLPAANGAHAGAARANGRLPTVIAAWAASPNGHAPTITLSYAQSLDGSITVEAGRPTAISSHSAMVLTHHLRASHDAILLGIGAVLADDPRLTVRLTDGADPQPVILDGRLRFPPQAMLMQHPRPPWIITRPDADDARQERLEAAGARVVRLPLAGNGRIDLQALIAYLAAQDVRSVMVEGGAQVIHSFLAARLVHRVVVTVAPRYLGGLNAVGNLAGSASLLPRLSAPQYEQFGPDMILYGDVVWE